MLALEAPSYKPARCLSDAAPSREAPMNVGQISVGRNRRTELQGSADPLKPLTVSQRTEWVLHSHALNRRRRVYVQRQGVLRGTPSQPPQGKSGGGDDRRREHRGILNKGVSSDEESSSTEGVLSKATVKRPHQQVRIWECEAASSQMLQSPNRTTILNTTRWKL